MDEPFITCAIEDRFVCFACGHMVLSARRVLPHMGAYVCFDCEFLKESIPLNEADISNKSFAPWNDIDVRLINEYQVSDQYLPFICLSEHQLIARREGLICAQCVGFKVSWVYSWVLLPAKDTS